jgi:trimeric autotransporter adhesin
VKINRIEANKAVCVSFLAAAFCLASFVGASAQTYTANDIYTVAGGGTVPTTPLTADIPGPTAAVKAASGNIYIASQDAAYVYELSTSGSLSIFAGKGYSGYSNDGKSSTTALIGGVTGLAIDSKGNIYFADAVGSRIRKVTMPSGIITTVAGNGTKCDKAGVCGDGGAATSANLNLPESVAVDQNGIIYIADTSDNRIRAVNTTTATVTIAGVSIPAGDINTVAGDSTACANSQDTCGDGGAANKANLTMPEGVAIDSNGNLYIADTHDQRIRWVAGATTGKSTIETFAGNGLPCTNPVSGCGDGGAPTSARLYLPRSLYSDAAGDVWIADTDSNRIRYIAEGSNIITSVVDSTGTQGFAGDGGAATAAQIDFPGGVFVDSSGNLLVADTGNQRVRQVTQSTGDIATVAGGGMGGDGGLPTAGTLALPWGVAEDASGNLYIADAGNNRVRKITNPGQSSAVITTYAGTGSAGYSGDGALAINATLDAPTSVALDSSGNLYIADSNNLVIREVNASTGNISTVFGNGQPCTVVPPGCGNGGSPTDVNFADPLIVTLDSSNNVYVSDYQAYTVWEWNISTGLANVVAGDGSQGYKGNGGPATSARLDHPAGLAITAAGIVIGDQWNDVIRYVNPSGTINNFALNTLAKFAGDGGPALKASMFNPLALASNPAGDVFISGGNDDLVQRVSAATGIFSNVAGNITDPVQGGYSGDGGPAIDARMENLGAYVDANDNLYIADGGTNRVRYVPLAPNVTYSTTQLNAGQWPVGTTGTAVPLTVTGAGGLDLQITNVGISGTNAADFAQTNTCGTLPALLSPQATCSASVTLTPSIYGEETATLTFTDNATGSTQQQITLTGYGPDFAISDSPSTITVTPGNSGNTTVTLTPQAKFVGGIGLTCTTGLPTGATCAFVPTTVQLYGGSAQTSVLTISTSSTTPTGTYTVTINGTYSGTYGTDSHTTTVTLTVN